MKPTLQILIGTAAVSLSSGRLAQGTDELGWYIAGLIIGAGFLFMGAADAAKWLKGR